MKVPKCICWYPTLWTLLVALLTLSLLGLGWSIFFSLNHVNFGFAFFDQHLKNHGVGVWTCFILVFLVCQGLALRTSAGSSRREDILRTRVMQVYLLASVVIISVLAISLTHVYTVNVGSIAVIAIVLLLSYFFTYALFAVEINRTNMGPKKLSSLVDVIFYLLEAFLFILVAIGWGIYGRMDVVVWSVVPVIVCFINVAAVRAQRSHRVKISGGKLYRGINGDIFDQKIVQQELKKPESSLAKVFRVLNNILKAACLLVTVLLVNGAVFHGAGVVAFRPSSPKFIAYEAPSGKTQEVFYHCQGNKTNLPTLILASDLSHSDWLGVLEVLSDFGHRACVWDPTGFGWSDYLLGSELKSEDHIFSKMLEGLKEAEPQFQPPYILVGFGGGGRTVYSHTVRHPETVHSVVLIDSGSINLTFGVQAALYNWSSEDYDAAILWSLTERRRYLEAVNGLLLPFGLSGLTWDGIGTYAQDWTDSLMKKNLWHSLTEKTFISQYWRAVELTGREKDVFEENVSEEIPVNVLVSVPTEDVIEDNVCLPYGLAWEECELELERSYLEASAKRALAKNGGRIIQGDHDFYLFTEPQFAVDAILDLYLN